jgi:group I intron endonuclease
MTTSAIYKIQSTINPKRFYIGSAVNIKERWYDHLYTLKNNIHKNPRLQNHFNKYGESDLIFIIIELCFPEFLTAREQFYINKLNPFFNICKIAGSSLGRKHSEKSKKKISEVKKGSIPWNKGKTGLQISWFKGKKHTEEAKGKNRVAHKGKQLSEETKQKIGEAGRGRNHTKEAKQKISIANKGRKRSEETKLKISELKKGNIPWNKGKRGLQVAWNKGMKKRKII